MKRNFANRIICVLAIIASSQTFTSCSSLWSRRDNTTDVNKSDAPRMVPKEQYDELARKYQELLETSKAKMPIAPAVETAKTTTEEVQVQPKTAEVTNLDPGELVNKIDQAIPDQHADGVDALGAETNKEVAKAGPKIPETMGIEHVNNTDDIDEQIVKLREVEDLVKVNKFENALLILRELENSKEKQIVVRSKMMLGDLLFSQGEYDLALQVYEEVIKKYAFSGYVIKALGKLVACSEKLKQPDKQAKYYSLLHDIFESV